MWILATKIQGRGLEGYMFRVYRCLKGVQQDRGSSMKQGEHTLFLGPFLRYKLGVYLEWIGTIISLNIL